VDKRSVDEFVGHQTGEQRRRYRHHHSDVKQKAITGVFGLSVVFREDSSMANLMILIPESLAQFERDLPQRSERMGIVIASNGERDQVSHFKDG